MRRALTICVWIVSLGALTAAGLITAALIMMVASLDPTEVITSGTEPWTDALQAIVAFLGLAILTVLALALWHSVRFKAVALILIALEVACVAWAAARFYGDYF